MLPACVGLRPYHSLHLPSASSLAQPAERLVLAAESHDAGRDFHRAGLSNNVLHRQADDRSHASHGAHSRRLVAPAAARGV